jgi:hypothetical protein
MKECEKILVAANERLGNPFIMILMPLLLEALQAMMEACADQTSAEIADRGDNIPSWWKRRLRKRILLDVWGTREYGPWKSARIARECCEAICEEIDVTCSRTEGASTLAGAVQELRDN